MQPAKKASKVLSVQELCPRGMRQKRASPMIASYLPDVMILLSWRLANSRTWRQWTQCNFQWLFMHGPVKYELDVSGLGSAQLVIWYHARAQCAAESFELLTPYCKTLPNSYTYGAPLAPGIALLCLRPN
jgi:hypothetical protein